MLFKIKKSSLSNILLVFVFICLIVSFSAIPVVSDSLKNSALSITDQRGESVQVPDNPQRIVVNFPPVVPYICTLEKSTSRIVGMNEGTKKMIKRGVISEVFPDLLNIPSDFTSTPGVPTNVEGVLKMNPDLVFENLGAQEGDPCESFEKVGIPAIGMINPKSDEQLYDQISIMGEILKKEDIAEKLITQTRSVHDEIVSKTGEIEEDKKPRVLILSNKKLSVLGSSNSFQDQCIQIAGGHNVMEGVSSTYTTATMEEIIKMNPDVIFIGSGSNPDGLNPEDLYSNSLDGQDWSSIKAVKDKKVYMYPDGDFTWFGPGPQASLIWEWMANVLHPEIFSYDVRADLKVFAQEYYGYDLNEDQMDRILSAKLNPSLTM